MNCLRWYGSSAHLVNCAFDQTCCAADHFIKTAQHLTNCAIFGQSRSTLAIGLGLRLRLGLGLGLGPRARASQVKPSNCSRRLEKLVRPSISDIPVTETQTDTEMIDISKTHTETNTEKIFNTDTIYI